MSVSSSAVLPRRAEPRGLPWLIITAGALVALLTFGPRSAMGFFQLPMLGELGWDRTTFGLAMALQNLAWGVSQPIFGAVADRFGTWRVLLLSSLLYAAGLLIMAFATAPIWLHVGGGILVGLAVGAGSFGIILSAFARNVTPQQRSMAFGIGTAGRLGRHVPVRAAEPGPHLRARLVGQPRRARRADAADPGHRHSPAGQCQFRQPERGGLQTVDRRGAEGGARP